jgi:hypothetical protein
VIPDQTVNAIDRGVSIHSEVLVVLAGGAAEGRP